MPSMQRGRRSPNGALTLQLVARLLYDGPTRQCPHIGDHALDFLRAHREGRHLLRFAHGQTTARDELEDIAVLELRHVAAVGEISGLRIEWRRGGAVALAALSMTLHAGRQEDVLA